jgi:hypothetical protein
MTAPALVFVEHVVWEPDDAWFEALEHLSTRFARATPLDVEAIRGHGPFHQQLDALAAWASDAGCDLDRELGRFLDEHLSMHVRPDPRTTRAVRALAVDAPVHAASALPPRAAESLLRHAGCWRSIARVHGDVRDAATLATVLDAISAGRIVAAAPTPLPSGADATPLVTPA